MFFEYNVSIDKYNIFHKQIKKYVVKSLFYKRQNAEEI